MADGFIVRRGGVGGEPIPAPTITLVSKTDTSITFTITNNSIQERDITYGLTTPPTTTTITVAANTTSANQTISGLDNDTQYIIYAQANGSFIAEKEVTTDKPIIYTAATGGTTEEYNLDGKRYRSHTFLSDGDFIVTTVGDDIDDRNKVEYLVIAGGASSGNNVGGGGGAGGYRSSVVGEMSGGGATAEPKITVTTKSYGITVGAGAASAPTNARGINGQNSIFDTVTAFGGGGGGAFFGLGASSGGSGGGATGNGFARGNGTSGQGYAGGLSTVVYGEPNNYATGAGGGAGGEGGQTNSPTAQAGAGGVGVFSSIQNGTPVERAGGGGGGGGATSTLSIASGGGGIGGRRSPGIVGQNGQANTGGGGGGTGGGGSGAGGSGIVVIRYEIAPN